MTAFCLDSRLENDSFFLGDLKVSQLRLMNDARYPWILLIPRLPEMHELTDIPLEAQPEMWQEIHTVSQSLATLFHPNKINTAALGNIVSQLHIHIIARYLHDPAWPRPVWGIGEAVPYALEEAEQRIQAIRASLRLRAA